MEKALRRTLRDGRFTDVSPDHRKIMRAIRSKRNRSTETRMRLAFVRAGISGWVLNFDSLPGSPDFYFLRRKLVVFVDGCFWHGCPTCGHIPHKNRQFWRTKLLRNRKRDKTVIRKLRSIGLTVFRFWEHDIQDDVAKCVRMIAGTRVRAKP
jgi:DNA mismatch endonuclease, patch repair protein